MEVITILEAVSQTLNKVEVKGRENLDMLLGCINILDQTAAQMRKETPKEEFHGG